MKPGEEPPIDTETSIPRKEPTPTGEVAKEEAQHEYPTDVVVPENRRDRALAATSAVVGILLCSAIWYGAFTGEEPNGGSERYETKEAAEIIDPSTRADVLAKIEAAESYVLDVEKIETHIHAHLRVIVDGKEATVPQIGVDMDTLTAAPIHTHDESGILHIETDTNHPKAPTLHDFLRIWKGGEAGAGNCYRLVEEPCQMRIERESGELAEQETVETVEAVEPIEDGSTIVVYVNRT